jgi:hypothetical protein
VQKEHGKPAAGVPVVEPKASRIKKSHGSGRPLLGPKAGFPGKLAEGPEPRTSHPALSQPPSLPPKLEGALLQVPDQAFAVQLRSIFRSAALTLHQLSDVDLVRYEAPDSGGSWDLALWEELAPVIAQTVTGVNALVSTVRSELQPKGQGTDLASLLDRTVDEVSDDADAERTADAQRILRRQSDELAALVAQLGERVRTPSVVSDRWNLLAEVQSFRSRFRSEVGNLVYDVASRYSELPRELLVPGYGQDLDAALEVRAALADLRRTVEARCRALRGAATEDVQWHAAQLGGELDAFGGSAAYRSLRAQDKRFLVEARARLGGLKTDVRGAGDIVLGFAAEFVTSLRNLSAVSQRAMLVEHDHAAWAATAVRLEQAEEWLGADPARAARELAEAAALARPLYGRDGELDTFLLGRTQETLARLAPAEARQAVEQFRAVLAGLADSESDS